MFEAGTFPCMWGHLTKFYAGGPQLAAAWGFIGATQPLAQVPPSHCPTLPLLICRPFKPCARDGSLIDK